jgi:hypothetical protein
MVKVDFDQVDDAENFASVPNGTYLCQVGEVRTRPGEDGTERWSLRWIVADGPFAGRTAAWDSLGFTPRTLRRAKLILQRMGVPVDGPQEITPHQLEGRRAMITVYARERIDPATGRRIISNRIPFAGVEPAPEGSEASAPIIWNGSNSEGADGNHAAVGVGFGVGVRASSALAGGVNPTDMEELELGEDSDE